MWWVPLAAAALDAFGADSANSQRNKLADKQMAFQERMSNTAWQGAGPC